MKDIRSFCRKKFPCGQIVNICKVCPGIYLAIVDLGEFVVVVRGNKKIGYRITHYEDVEEYLHG